MTSSGRSNAHGSGGGSRVKQSMSRRNKLLYIFCVKLLIHIFAPFYEWLLNNLKHSLPLLLSPWWRMTVMCSYRLNQRVGKSGQLYMFSFFLKPHWTKWLMFPHCVVLCWWHHKPCCPFKKMAHIIHTCAVYIIRHTLHVYNYKLHKIHFKRNWKGNPECERVTLYSFILRFNLTEVN